METLKACAGPVHKREDRKAPRRHGARARHRRGRPARGGPQDYVKAEGYAKAKDHVKAKDYVKSIDHVKAKGLC